MRTAPFMAAVLAVVAGPVAGQDLREVTWDRYNLLLVETRHSSTAPCAFVRLTERGVRKFEFTYDNGEERVDSRAATVIRRTPSGRTVRAHVRLTDAERDTAYWLLESSGFFDSPGRVGKGSIDMPDLGLRRLEVDLDSTWKIVEWNPTGFLESSILEVFDRAPVDPEEPGLREFDRRLREMLSRRDSYRRLPRESTTGDRMD